MRSTQPLKVVSVLDPALDLVAMEHDLTVYMSTRDPELLKFKPGIKPTWYYVKRADAHMFMTWVRESSSDGERFRRAFQCGVAKIENIETLDDTKRETWVPDTQQQTPLGMQTYWSDRDVANIPLVYVDEIGQIAWDRAYLDPKAEDSFQPPLSVRSALARRISRDVGAHVKHLRSLRSEAHPEGKAETSPADGEKDTAATATG